MDFKYFHWFCHCETVGAAVWLASLPALARSAYRGMWASAPCIGQFPSCSLGLRLHVLTIGPGWPSAGRSAYRGMCGLPGASQPQAAFGVA